MKKAVDACVAPGDTAVVEETRSRTFDDGGEPTYEIEVIFLDDSGDVARLAALAEAAADGAALPASTTKAERAAIRRREDAHLLKDGSTRSEPRAPPPSSIYEVRINESGPMGMALIMRTISGHNVVVVRSVTPGGRGEKAGILVNSRLYAVNDIRIGDESGDDPYEVLGINKVASSTDVLLPAFLLNLVCP